MNVLLIFLLAGAVYSYLLYPLILLCLPRRSERKFSNDKEHLPEIDLIITAHNEADNISAKLENALSLDYPKDSLKIIVASDGSTDETNSIVESYADRGVQLVDVRDHKGKEHAQLRAIHSSTNEIIVFSDVATFMEEDALRAIADVFSDSTIGAVSSEDRFISESGEIAGEGLYVKYEMWLRGLESDRAGLVGLSGSFFAARREICDEWDTKSPSDFNTALQCNAHGLVAISSSSVLGYYKDLADPQKEYKRKVRTVLRGITALFRHRTFLNPKNHGLFAFQLWSHKVMRWMVPWFLLGTALLSAAFYKGSLFFAFICIAQIGFYMLAIIGWLSERARNNALVRVIFFFVQVNVAIAQASIKYVAGERVTAWAPSKR